jgi:hypothetical protein
VCLLLSYCFKPVCGDSYLWCFRQLRFPCHPVSSFNVPKTRPVLLSVCPRDLPCQTARTVYRQVCHSTSLIVSHCSYSVQTSVSQHITYRVTLLVQCTDKCVRTSRINVRSSRNSSAVHALISAVFCCTSVDICEPAATSLKCVNNAHVPFQTADGGTSIPVQI